MQPNLFFSLLLILLRDCSANQGTSPPTSTTTTTTTTTTPQTSTSTPVDSTTVPHPSPGSSGMSTGWAIVMSLAVLGVAAGCAWAILPGILRIKVGGSTPISQ